MTILVTGGAGFIGSALVRSLASQPGQRIVNVDKLTYAGSLASLREVTGLPTYHFEQVDICDASALRRIFRAYQPVAVVHLAAESHVDRSIDGPADFITTNVVGTFTLLSEALRYWNALHATSAARFRFLHVSTDEVFGSIPGVERAEEGKAYAPTSPYSASKAASDHLARAWHHTYGLPVTVTNCSNNFGPFQMPEKLIPLAILNAIEGQTVPVYGDGENVRDWLHVDDHVSALLAVLASGEAGSTYLIGADNERRNIDVVRTICAIVDDLQPDPGLAPREELIRFVTDRPGHDRRYAIDSSRIQRELGWTPSRPFESSLRETVHWYLHNRSWWEPMRSRQWPSLRAGLGED